MNYALIENDIVTNIIWLSPTNAADFPDAVAYGDRPVQIGDSYIDGIFYRDGEKILTQLEALRKNLADAQAALAEALSAEEINAAMRDGVNSI